MDLNGMVGPWQSLLTLLLLSYSQVEQNNYPTMLQWPLFHLVVLSLSVLSRTGAAYCPNRHNHCIS